MRRRLVIAQRRLGVELVLLLSRIERQARPDCGAPRATLGEPYNRTHHDLRKFFDARTHYSTLHAANGSHSTRVTPSSVVDQKSPAQKTAMLRPFGASYSTTSPRCTKARDTR